MATVNIRKKDGATQSRDVSNGTLAMAAGANVSLAAMDGVAAIRAVDNAADTSHYFQANLDAILGHADALEGGDGQPVFRFGGPEAGDGYYVSRLNGVAPLLAPCLVEGVPYVADVAITGGPTLRVAEGEGAVWLADIGRPDLDCDDYARVALLVNRLREVLDGVKDQINGSPSGAATAAVFGLHKQYQAMQRLWNFLVRTMSLVVNLSFQESDDGSAAVYMQYRVHNNTDAPAPLAAVSVGLLPSAALPDNSVRMTLDKIIKVTRTTPSGRVAMTPSLAGGGTGLAVALKTGGTWTVTPGAGVSLAPDETISVFIEFSLSTSAQAALPTQLDFTVSTSLPDDTGQGQPHVVQRGRSVYIPKASLPAPPEEDD